ncbi:hypothetical protein OF83DRAFT_1113575 [Amylostereum chailletii]|nr:hypothetical protein OF83DRAFT_1113575 [Amylostereum chailletii]
MAPNLQGLNIVQPAQPSSSSSFLADSSQDLLNLPQNYPELSAQLDLWTNLSFQSDEPLVRRDPKKDGAEESPSLRGDDEDEEGLEDDRRPAQADNHQNVVMGHPVNVAHPPAHHQPSQHPAASSPNIDFQALLAGFGLDPFNLPTNPSMSPAGIPSLAQLLSMPFPPVPNAPVQQQQQQQVHQSTPEPATKRARTRKASITTSVGDAADEEPSPSGTPLSAAEDKRRRNTAASARFRLKKKEREAALETKAKELESRVSELERECEGLRRENGWLKGLVVGVTGVGAGAAAQQQTAAAGQKRQRDEGLEGK